MRRVYADIQGYYWRIIWKRTRQMKWGLGFTEIVGYGGRRVPKIRDPVFEVPFDKDSGILRSNFVPPI